MPTKKQTPHKRRVARHLREVARAKAAQSQPVTRRRAKAWLDPLRAALSGMLSGELDTVDDMPVVVLSRSQNTLARVDHMLNSVASAIVRADRAAEPYMQPLYALARQITKHGAAYPDEVHAALAAINVAEDVTIRTPPTVLDAAIRDTRIEIELRNRAV